MFNDDFLRTQYEDPTHRCTRYAGHDGPCNGLPCDSMLAKMEASISPAQLYGLPAVDNAANADGSNRPTNWRLTVRAMDALGPNDHLLTGEPLATMPEHALSDIWNLLGPDCDPTDWAGIREAVAALVRRTAALQKANSTMKQAADYAEQAYPSLWTTGAGHLLKNAVKGIRDVEGK